MRIETQLYRWGDRTQPEGTLVWDSETGEIGGTLADEIRREADEARARGWVPAGPQFAYSYPAHDPLHKPDQFTALLSFMGFILTYPDLAELLRSYNPKFPYRKYDPNVVY